MVFRKLEALDETISREVIRAAETIKPFRNRLKDLLQYSGNNQHLAVSGLRLAKEGEEPYPIIVDIQGGTPGFRFRNAPLHPDDILVTITGKGYLQATYFVSHISIDSWREMVNPKTRAPERQGWLFITDLDFTFFNWIDAALIETPLEVSSSSPRPTTE